MATLILTGRGQVILRKEILKHLDVRPGQRLDVEMLPDNEVRIRSARPTGRIEDVFGMLAGRTKKVATIEEISDAIADGWAGKR